MEMLIRCPSVKEVAGVFESGGKLRSGLKI